MPDTNKLDEHAKTYHNSLILASECLSNRNYGNAKYYLEMAIREAITCGTSDENIRVLRQELNRTMRRIDIANCVREAEQAFNFDRDYNYKRAEEMLNLAEMFAVGGVELPSSFHSLQQRIYKFGVLYGIEDTKKALNDGRVTEAALYVQRAKGYAAKLGLKTFSEIEALEVKLKS